MNGHPQQFANKMCVVLTAFSCTVAHQFARAAGNCPKDRLFVEGTIGFDEFGSAVAIDGDRAVIGAPSASSEPSAVYTFRKETNGWQLDAELNSPEDDFAVVAGIEFDYQETSTRFGGAVALDGDTLVVGEAGHGRGKAHVYRLVDDAWMYEVELSRLVPGGDPIHAGTLVRTLGSFGHAVAISGDRIAIGGPTSSEPLPSDDPNEHMPSGSFGAIYVFQRMGNHWALEDILTTGPEPLDGGFGWSVAMDADTLVSGSPWKASDDAIGSSIGAAHMFSLQNGAWVRQAELRKPEGGSSADRDFGESVAVFGNTVMIGSPFGDDYGRVFMFERSGGEWKHTATLKEQDSELFGNFGFAVALSADHAVVNYRNPYGYQVFDREGATWQPRSLMSADVTEATEPFGVTSIAVDKTTVLLGTAVSQYPDYAGTGFVFDLAPGANGCSSTTGGGAGSGTGAEDGKGTGGGGGTDVPLPVPACACGACSFAQALMLGITSGMLGKRRRRARRTWCAA